MLRCIRELGTDVVNRLVTSVLSAWPGHTDPRLFGLSQSVYCTFLPETLIRSIVCLEPTPPVNL